jgi:DNA-binding CsgD family transcriptional regulator
MKIRSRAEISSTVSECQVIKSKTDYADVAYGIVTAPTVGESLSVLSSHYGIDFVTYHLASTIVTEVDAPYVRTTYPDRWVSAYLLRGYIHVDPIVREGFLRQLPFDWREIEITAESFGFLEDASRHGVGPCGFSIPIADKGGRRAILSLNSNVMIDAWDEITAAYRSDWVDLAYLIHQKAVFELHGASDPIPIMTARERECLYWSALGKDYKDIALILGLSHHTTRSYIKSARTKLGCATISAASALALKLRIISI